VHESPSLVGLPPSPSDLDTGETLRGFTFPRVATIDPAGASRGREVVAFARDVLRIPLLPWQEWALEHGLVAHRDRWASRTVAILVGRQNGKTTLVGIRALAGMVLFGERDVLAAAQNRDVALDAWRHALDLAEDAGLDVHSVCRTNGREAFWIGDARYKVVSATRRGGRGLSADLVILDELREYRDWAGWAALEKTRRARASSQVWAISNEGDEGSIVLTALAEQGRQAADADTPTDLAWFEWSAAPDLARADRLGWQQANPALGTLIQADTIASEAAHDDPVVFETEVLCRRVASLRPWLPVGTWDACADRVHVPDGAEVAFALEGGAEHRHATIAAAFRRADGLVHVEAVAGFAHTDGPVLARASARLSELVDRWPATGVHVIARSGSEAAAARAVEGTDVPLVAISMAEFVRAANAFHEAVIARTLVHPGDPMTGAHVGAVTSDGPMRRRSVHADIDAATALVLARHGALHAPARTETQDWVAF
jgi:hypothetical protein